MAHLSLSHQLLCESIRFGLMEFPIKLNTVKSGWSIVYIEGSQVIIIIIIKKSFDFVLANSADPDEMPHYAAFHLCLHCLPKYMFRGF